MSIYPKRNARGSLTGKYLVEVNTATGRKRATTETLVEARNIEERFKGVMGPAGDFKPMPATMVAPKVSNPLYTVGSLRNDARVIWKGNKDEYRSLQQFDTCCDILGDHTDIKSVRTKQLDMIVETLRGRGLSDTTCHRYLATVSGALRWAHKRDHIDGMPHIPWPEQGKPRDAVFTEEDQGRFLEWLALRSVAMATEARGYHSTTIIYRVLFATGMRISELLGLNEEDIDVDNGTVTLRDTKNGDNRTVPLEAQLCADLRGLLDSDDMPNYDQLRRVVVRAASDLGIDYSITPHVVRHTVVTRLEAAGVGLKTIGALVGHRSIATTSRYAHPNQATLRAATAKLKG